MGFYVINAHNEIEAAGDALFLPSSLLEGHLPYPFANVKGDLLLSGMDRLTSLVNTPRSVGGAYSLDRCVSLTSWEGNRVVSCGALHMLANCGIKTFTGGPKEVRDEITVSRQHDLYDLPTGSWTSLCFDLRHYGLHNPPDYSQDDVLSLLHSLRELPQDQLPLVLASPDRNPVERWIASRLLEGKEPFANFS